MDIHIIINNWVDETLGSHFRYRQLGEFHYIRCECREYRCAIVRIENNAFCIIDPKRSIDDELANGPAALYDKKDDLFSIQIADPKSFETIKPLILKTHKLGKKVWKARFKSLK